MTKQQSFLVTLALLVTTAGCAAPATQSKSDVIAVPVAPAVTNASQQPHVITDLSALSASNSLAEIQRENRLVTHAASPAITGGETHIDTSQSNIDRFFLSNPQGARYNEDSRPPGETILLNGKARQYAQFARRLLNQTLAAVQNLESERIASRQMPDHLQPVVLTAVLDPDGKLREIIIDQHSGVGAVDKLLIDGCKKGLWSRNPPAGALSADGNYRLRIEAMIINQSFDRGGIYTFNTRLGLGIM
ncbi:MAG: hypothetical protein ACREQN_15280 [Candidatus Binataceae bacterium]